MEHDCDDDVDIIQDIAAALAQGQKLEAIKIYRTAKGASLSEAKQFIDQLIPQLQAEDPERFGKLNSGGSGCGITAAVVILVVSLLAN